MNVYIIRDIKKLKAVLDDIVVSIWPNAKTKDIEVIGNHKRYTFSVNYQNALLDIYQNANGSTTFRATGSNIAISRKLQASIENISYHYDGEQKNYSVMLGSDWIKHIVEYLKAICERDSVGSYNRIENATNHSIVHSFVSPIGDKLTLTEHQNGRIVIQGKPLLLYNEFISLISYSPKIEISDIIQATKDFGLETVDDVSEARQKLKKLMPTAFSGCVDDTIWKVFSPAMTLVDVDKDMEDYSYCVFPALRALEGYLNFLLDEKHITIDLKHNYGTVFDADPLDSSKKRVLPSVSTRIGDASYDAAILKIYNYLTNNRNVIFHMNQIFIATKLISNKTEAISTISDVALLIEETYKSTHP